jgi:hypothetical protein
LPFGYHSAHRASAAANTATSARAEPPSLEAAPSYVATGATGLAPVGAAPVGAAPAHDAEVASAAATGALGAGAVQAGGVLVAGATGTELSVQLVSGGAGGPVAVTEQESSASYQMVLLGVGGTVTFVFWHEHSSSSHTTVIDGFSG